MTCHERRYGIYRKQFTPPFTLSINIHGDTRRRKSKSMAIEGVSNLLELFKGIHWKWTKEKWDKIASTSNLQRIDDSSRTYYRYDGFELYALISDNNKLLSVTVNIEMYYEGFEDNYGDEYDAKAEEFKQKYNETLVLAIQTIGRPDFEGNCNDVGFPHYETSNRVALWNVHSGRLMVQYNHEYEFVPFRITVRVIPPENLE